MYTILSFELNLQSSFSVQFIDVTTQKLNVSSCAPIKGYGDAFPAQQELIERYSLGTSVQHKPLSSTQRKTLSSTLQKASQEEKKKARQSSQHHPFIRKRNQERNEENGNVLTPSSNDLVQALCRQGQLDKALHALFDMLSSPPSFSSYLSLLNLCIKSKSIVHVKHVYAHITSHKVVLRGMLGDYLVMALARCGALEDAHHVSNSLPHLTVFAWSAIISAYSEQGCGCEALEIHHLMLEQGINPDKYTFVGLFRACGSIPDLSVGRKLHIEACIKGFTLEIFVGNSLVSMYGKHGAILEAEDSFRMMPQRDVVSWNAMFSVYVEQDHEEKALQLYRQMQGGELDPNQQTFVIVLQACMILAEKEEALLMGGTLVKLKALTIGEALHSDARSKGFSLDLYVGTALTTMYGKCGAVAQAESLFSSLPQRSIISWNSMLSTFIEQRQGEKALQVYKLLHEEGVILDELTVVFALQACGILAENGTTLHETVKQTSLRIGQALHADLYTKGFKSDAFVGTALLGMYSKCESFSQAENVFNVLSERSMVTWSAMMVVYLEQGLGRRALQSYRQMQEESLSPNVQTLVLAIQACGTLVDDVEVFFEENFEAKLLSLESGHALHNEACKSGFASYLPVSTALVSMYGKCGSIIEAESVFRSLTQPDAVTYTAILSAQINEGYAVEALCLYKELQQHIVLDDVTLICLLQACDETGSLELCKELHFLIVAAGYDRVASVTSSLIHTYGSCASMVDGQAAFDGLCEPDITSWTACIMGHAGEGNVAVSSHVLDQLNLAGLRPDEATIISALIACDHTGNIAKAFEYFDSMSRDHGIVPQLKHYGVMIELLGRAGDFQRIQDLLAGMPIKADAAIWLCLLGACCAHGHSVLAKEAFIQTLNLEPNQAFAYILMSNACMDCVLQ